MNTSIVGYVKNGCGFLNFTRTDHAGTGFKQNAPIAITGFQVFIKKGKGKIGNYMCFEKPPLACNYINREADMERGKVLILVLILEIIVDEGLSNTCRNSISAVLLRFFKVAL